MDNPVILRILVLKSKTLFIWKNTSSLATLTSLPQHHKIKHIQGAVNFFDIGFTETLEEAPFFEKSFETYEV